MLITYIKTGNITYVNFCWQGACFSLVWSFTCASARFEPVYWGTWHRSQRWKIRLLSGETLLQAKQTPLVVGGTHTQVLVDNMDIAAIMYACVGMYVLFNVVIQQQSTSQGKSTWDPVFYMLIRIHEAQ